MNDNGNNRTVRQMTDSELLCLLQLGLSSPSVVELSILEDATVEVMVRRLDRDRLTARLRSSVAKDQR